ncbi:MAG: E3 ubiquitin-protein ligase ubr1, partial [Marteilia pararefringens]
ECAKDETTALCRQCFENSDHVNHDYNVGISSGNGSCDCGDSDAWTGCTGCHFHTGVDSHTIDEVRRMFSQEAFQKIVTHELPILFDNLGRDLRLSEDFFIPDDSTDQFYLILLNNEIHDIRTVKDILSLKMTHVQAAQCALLVDSYGCFKVLEGSIVECRSFAKIIASQSELHDSNICLRTLIVQKQKYLNFLRANNCLELLTILDDRDFLTNFFFM